ncbi:hypothetical protein CEXT_305891 [Caerostris extrusa]|uniref:Uncharacterized protein n=1 Tax=Caerostris extrusa TaxID=172846 RepID=A0AAV4VK97_CAEEX|nr:hypothetical protein CEXT_305891 [Caerostris extrusa]
MKTFSASYICVYASIFFFLPGGFHYIFLLPPFCAVLSGPFWRGEAIEAKVILTPSQLGTWSNKACQNYLLGGVIYVSSRLILPHGEERGQGNGRKGNISVNVTESNVLEQGLNALFEQGAVAAAHAKNGARCVLISTDAFLGD